MHTLGNVARLNAGYGASEVIGAHAHARSRHVHVRSLRGDRDRHSRLGHVHTRIHTRMHARTHTRMHTRMHAYTHTYR